MGPQGYEDEADYYAHRQAERAYPGEAYHGATQDWAIVDVPPGTERVRMDGAGGGSQEVTWQRYNGVRRSRFDPNGGGVPDERERMGGGEMERRKYVGVRPKTDNLWTEITKDLVTREAIEGFGYEFEETEYFFYVMEYLRYVRPPLEPFLPSLSPCLVPPSARPADASHRRTCSVWCRSRTTCGTAAATACVRSSGRRRCRRAGRRTRPRRPSPRPRTTTTTTMPATRPCRARSASSPSAAGTRSASASSRRSGTTAAAPSPRRAPCPRPCPRPRPCRRRRRRRRGRGSWRRRR